MVKKKSAFLGVGLVVVTALLFGWLYSRNSLFILSNIVVEADSEELKRSLEARLVSFLGRRLTSLSMKEVEEVLKKNPRVKKASFQKRWPSTLEVYIEKHQAVAAAFVEKRLWWLNEEGVAFTPAEEALPLVLLRSYEGSPPTVPWAAVCAWLRKSGSPSWIDELEWKNGRGLVARNLESSVEVDLGFTAFEEAWKRADFALRYFKKRAAPIASLDATYQHRVVVRMQGGLRNFDFGLNLKELVRRRGESPAAAR